MKQSVEFQQICFKNNHRVQAQLCKQGGLILRISKIDTFMTKVYEKKLNSLKVLDDQISLYYSNFQEIIQFIKDPSNITIHESKGTSKKESANQPETDIILQIIEGQSLKQVIAQVNLPFINKVQNQGSCREAADAISRICNNNGQIKLSQVKQLFMAVAISLRTIERQKQNEGENIFLLKQKISDQMDKKAVPQKVKQKQFESIQKKYSAMQLQNKQMFESFQKLIRSSIEDAKNKLSKRVPEDIQKQVKAQFEQIHKLIQKLPQKVGESLIKKLNGSKPEIEQIKTDIQNLKQIIKQSKTNTLKKKLTLKQNSVAPSTWLQKQFNHSFKISIENNFIIAHSPVNIFGTFDNTKDGQEHIKKFKVYIANMKQYIGVGLADDKYRTQKQMGNNLIKLGNNGHVFDGNSEQFSKQGFCEGQEVLVKFNTKTGQVSWSVDGQIRYSLIVKKGIKSLIPLIVMLNKYDAVCIMKN